MSIFRGFLAIDIGSNQNIIKLENEIKKTKANIKLVEPENIHITIKFLGDTDEQLIDEIENIIKKSVEKIKPFNISLKSIGVFPNTNYIKIIWIGIESGPEISTITDNINEKLIDLGFKKENRGFSPHLTIGRVKSVKNKDKILGIISNYKDFEFAKITVDSIKLKKSVLTEKGPIYTTLKDIKI